mmetsp:Transcript_8913/g.15451  ORF Transcript_8913/g.15451 Transcript_8913/m.15451 type:complete len:236 (-) Transcript_8913:34-741(-)
MCRRWSTTIGHGHGCGSVSLPLCGSVVWQGRRRATPGKVQVLEDDLQIVVNHLVEILNNLHAVNIHAQLPVRLAAHCAKHTHIAITHELQLSLGCQRVIILRVHLHVHGACAVVHFVPDDDSRFVHFHDLSHHQDVGHGMPIHHEVVVVCYRCILIELTNGDMPDGLIIVAAFTSAPLGSSRSICVLTTCWAGHEATSTKLGGATATEATTEGQAVHFLARRVCMGDPRFDENLS